MAVPIIESSLEREFLTEAGIAEYSHAAYNAREEERANACRTTKIEWIPLCRIFRARLEARANLVTPAEVADAQTRMVVLGKGSDGLGGLHAITQESARPAGYFTRGECGEEIAEARGDDELVMFARDPAARPVVTRLFSFVGFFDYTCAAIFAGTWGELIAQFPRDPTIEFAHGDRAFYLRPNFDASQRTGSCDRCETHRIIIDVFPR